MKKLLITGSTGFVGSHMVDLLISKNKYKIFCTRRYHLSNKLNINNFKEKVIWIDCDLTDSVAVNRMFRENTFDYIYHFAAESFVSPSWDHPLRYMDVNYKGTVNILEGMKEFSPKSRILIPGSGEEYGEIYKNELPINNKTTLRPVNPYAVTKISQDLISYVYHRSYGLNVVRLRTFNHEGPRRENFFGLPSYAYQIARIEKKLQKPIIEVGHLKDYRNFTHIDDICRAYYIAMYKCKSGETYLVGNDNKKNFSTYENILKTMISKSNFKNKIKIKQNKKFTRPTDVPFLIADTKKFKSLTKWQPKISLDQIIQDTLNYWRKRVEEDIYVDNK